MGWPASDGSLQAHAFHSECGITLQEGLDQQTVPGFMLHVQALHLMLPL